MTKLRTLAAAVLAAALLVCLARPDARAAEPAKAPLAPESWAGQLDLLGKWLAQQKGGEACKERCFVLDRLRVSGAVGKGTLAFELEGGVLAAGPVAVPLFGPPSKLRVVEATLDGKRAPIGFEADHYYLFTSAPHFVVKGSLELAEDRALALPGPLNTFEADLTQGRVAEGARLSGVSNVTVHFDAAAERDKPVEPPVFQVSRAVRVGKEAAFEYKLVVRSAADLGVLRFPMKQRERVVDVQGVTGWRVDGADLVLPAAGRALDVTVTGTLPALGTFAPDERSPYEWFLFESDAEHRLNVKSEARQVDSAESPIARTQPSARLYLAQRGQSLEVTSVALASTEVLAAIVKNHHRTAVVTRAGDVVADDVFAYENNGIDYLAYEARGKPIFLATDGRAERIMSQDGKPGILLPLRTGSHAARVQSLAEASLAPLGGVLDVAVPAFPLTASTQSLTVGVPAGVFPLALLGGDRVHATLDGADACAVIVGVVLALLVFGARGARAFGAVAIAGLWFVVAPVYVVLVAGLVLFALGRVLRRLLGGWALRGAFALTSGVVVVAALVLVVATFVRTADRAASSAPPPPQAWEDGRYREESQDVASAEPAAPPTGGAAAKLGNVRAQNATGATGGILKGVTPVALPLPAHARSLAASRELVTPERPFRPRLVYVTAWGLLPLGLGWLACVGALARIHRVALRRALARLREALRAPPAPPVTPAEG